jgi:hypothetical protein
MRGDLNMLKIVIQTDADFTPKGKRTARVVTTRSSFGRGRQLRWYVSGRLYNRLPVTTDNVKLTREWLEA